MKFFTWVAAVALRAAPAKWAFQDLPFRVSITVPARGPMEIPFSAATVRLLLDNAELPTQISDELEAGMPGRVSWFAPRAGVYWLYYANRPFLQRDREPVGNGDNLFYNRPGGWDLLGVGMKNDQALPVDWDGDGRPDILCGVGAGKERGAAEDLP